MTDLVIWTWLCRPPARGEAIHSGASVLGFDVRASVVDGLNGGRSHVDDLADGDIADMIAAGFRATTDESEIASATTAVICVPTPLAADGGPDLTAVESATHALSRYLRPGMPVVLESTTYPGTTDEVVRPILEESGLRAGADFNLRSPRNASTRATNNSVRATRRRSSEAIRPVARRALRASTAASSTPSSAPRARARRRRQSFLRTRTATSTSRWSTRWPGSATTRCRPPGRHPCGEQQAVRLSGVLPGPGVGGHCIPIDPNDLSHNVRAKLGYPFRFVELAQDNQRHDAGVRGLDERRTS